MSPQAQLRPKAAKKKKKKNKNKKSSQNSYLVAMVQSLSHVRLFATP